MRRGRYRVQSRGEQGGRQGQFTRIDDKPVLSDDAVETAISVPVSPPSTGDEKESCARPLTDVFDEKCEVTPTAEKVTEEATQDQEDIDTVTKQPTRPLDKKGTSGNPIALESNYFRLKQEPDWCLHQHSVEFNIKEDRIKVRKAWFRRAFQPLGIGYIFDGAQLFTSVPIVHQNEGQEGATSIIPLEYVTQDQEGKDVVVTVKFVKKLEPGNPVYIQFNNLLIRKCMSALGMQELGRGYYEPGAAIKYPQDRLELWPGYITSMRSHEHDVLLCVEATHKVIRMDSLLATINSIRQNANVRNTEAVLRQEFQDSVVMTMYNKKTYTVADIKFEYSPKDTFNFKGVDTTYVQYFLQRYQITIMDLDQPLLVCRTTNKRFLKQQEDCAVFLIPELCQPTGLTDSLRSNFNLMKKLAEHLHQGPSKKASVILNFMKRFCQNPQIAGELERWGLQFDNNLIHIDGRVFKKENIVFGNGNQQVNHKADFSDALKSKKMLLGYDLQRWAMLIPRGVSEQDAQKLVKTMIRVATPLDMNISQPQPLVFLGDIGQASYMRSLDELLLDTSLEMVFVVLPNNKADLYSSIKKRLAVDRGIPSQCFLSKNVNSKNLMAIATKVVVQMNAKLGGDPWTMQLPLKKIMFIGFDVYGGARGAGGGIVGAMVASFTPCYTRYYSTTTNYRSKEKLSSEMYIDFGKCLEAYRAANGGSVPDKIFFFRDGVGDGQLNFIYTTELTSILDEMHRICGALGAEVPKLTFLIVSKKINTRLFAPDAKGRQNPPPGTIVDDVITLPERYDFFLVSNCARQGTVSPCSYNVIYDNSGLEPDKVQKITYKLCHMYFNWSGAIAVPAPCQYAHKLAAITGVAYQGHANANLRQLLHFL